MSHPPPFASLVRSRMRERGLGLRELCRAADVDPSYLSKVLAEKRDPPWEEPVLRRLAGALELDAARLIAAAGRIPAEWGAIWRDEELFAAVHRLAGGGPIPHPAVPGAYGAPGGGRPRAPARPVPRPSEPPARPFKPRELGDELL